MITEMWSKLGTLSSYRHQDLVAFKQNFVTYTDKDGKKYTMNYSDEFVSKVMGGWTLPITTYYKVNTTLNPTGLNMIKDIFGQERELYYLGEQSLDATVAAMQKRAQEALDSLK